MPADAGTGKGVFYSSDTTRYPMSFHRKRFALVCGGSLATYTALMTGVGFVWYGRQPSGSFRWFDDSREWLQQDKTGHIYAPYFVTVFGYEMLRWSGVKPVPAALSAGAFGFMSLTVMEIPDGFKPKYGASWSDIVFNLAGAALATGQYLAWNEQRIYCKYSFHLVDYPAGPLRERAQELFGKTIIERALKDYNGTVIWLSANLCSFNHRIRPRWLNVAFGYGAGNLYGGFQNIWYDKNGVLHDHSDLKRYRSFYFSIDADLSKIPVKSKTAKVVLGVLNVFKLPAPALEINTLGQVVFRPMFALNFDYPILIAGRR